LLSTAAAAAARRASGAIGAPAASTALPAGGRVAAERAGRREQTMAKNRLTGARTEATHERIVATQRGGSQRRCATKWPTYFV